jgi:hypothetical protein
LKVKELIAALSELNPEMEIMILDGFNGGGYPRHINCKPYKDSPHLISQKDVANCGDCEDIGRGHEVYTIGYGCY